MLLKIVGLFWDTDPEGKGMGVLRKGEANICERKERLEKAPE